MTTITDHTITPFPEVDQLTDKQEFPDLFEMMDGSRIETLSEWRKRREELKQLIQHYEYGFLPPAPAVFKIEELTRSLIGKGVYRSVRLTFGEEINICLTLHIYMPAGDGPFPVVVRGDLCWDSIYKTAEKYFERGYAFIEFDRTEIDKDNDNRLDGLHACFPDTDFGTLAAWAWGYSRVVDFIMNSPEFDSRKIIATGHSRGGKTALLAGVLDERIALTNSHCSGIGGSGPNRFLITGETIDDISDPKRFYYWFNKRYLEFRGEKVTKLPFDQHAMVALLAPRAYLSTNALADEWANPEGTLKAYHEAIKAYSLYESPLQTGIHFREGEHEQNESDWAVLLDFADDVLFGKGKANLGKFPG